jgi:Ca-activated chloride channel family protein
MNARGLPDTLTIDPIFTYRVVVHTVPPSVRENVVIKPGIHNLIAVDAGMGTLQLKMGSGPPDGNIVQCIVRRSGELTTLNAQELGTRQRYRVGVYDLEVLTLPRVFINDVKVDQGGTTDIIVPKPGVLNILPSTPGPGAIFLRQGDELIWVTDLDPAAIRGQYRLQPGNYQITYRSRNARRTELTLTREATIESGRSVTINF